MDEAFCGCSALTEAPVIPSSVTEMRWTFRKCISLTGEIEINASPTSYDECFAGTSQPIVLTGTSTVLAELAATATNGNVTVKE